MIEITVDDREILAVLADLNARAEDMTPAFDAIGKEMEARISRRFEDTTDPAGRLWQPHPTRGFPWEYDPTYPKTGNRRLLDRSGDMLDSLNHQADRDGVTVGFDVGYAAYHEWGTKHMQRRSMLFEDPVARTLGDDDRDAVLGVLSEFLSP